MISTNSKNIKSGIDVSIPVDNKRDSGKMGRHYHEEMSKHLPMQKGRGPDVKRAGVEIKTKQQHSTAPNTQCSMKRQRITDTPYDRSLMHDKMQKQLRAIIDSNNGEIAKETLLDMSDPDIQDVLRDEYEACRAKIAAGATGTVKALSGGWVIMEHLPKKDQFKIRISNKGMKTIENIAQRDHNAWDAIFPANYGTGGTTDLGSVAR